MQQLLWTEKELKGGGRIDVVLEKPKIPQAISAWLRPGDQIPTEVLEQIKRVDSYRDVAVLCLPLPPGAEARAYRIPDLEAKSGLKMELPASPPSVAPWVYWLPSSAAVPLKSVVDLTSHMAPDGRLQWHAPEGNWLVIRFGHATNLKMTRPCPAAAVGLECDRLAKVGIDTHYNAFLKPIIEAAESAAGRSFAYVHIDSWEAGGQNWTATFPAEFQRRRGYNLRPWLPALAGRVVGSAELSERFLWDVRLTVSEMIRDNYAHRLRELVLAHGLHLSTEPYGKLCIDNLAYAGNADFPMSEFWAMGNGKFPSPGGYERSSKAIASAAHTYGKRVAGAESFTGSRGWRDHPFLLKGMGDLHFSRGISRLVLHNFAHQPRNDMIPGMTHRRWGEFFERFNTWWDYITPWTDYLTRSQYLLQQGVPVADVACCFGEGAPLSVDDMHLDIPAGYDFDFCSSENVLAMTVDDGWIVAAPDTRYRYLLLPDSDRMTLPLARKIRALVSAGAKVICARKLVGPPGLTGYPRSDGEVGQIGAELWASERVFAHKTLDEVFTHDGLKPDFEGQGLVYVHRRVGGTEVYFVSHQGNRAMDRVCTFRASGQPPELWDAETGSIRPLPHFTVREGRTSIPLHFEPLQSWFIVFRSTSGHVRAETSENFAAPRQLREIIGEWQVAFDTRWGGPAEPVTFEKLTNWSQHPDPHIHYYSGTAVYRKSLTLSENEASGKHCRLFLDLGAVEVMARVKLNGTECGIAWKPPYQLDITAAARPGVNELEIEVVNLWINRMVGDEQLPEDCEWKDWETLAAWPEWFKERRPRPSGRYTFTTCKFYTKDTPLVASGLLGPARLKLAGSL